MTRFKTAAIDTNNVGSWVERRRKGRMIRKQHTVTGAWTPWMISEFTAPRSYSPKKVAEIAAREIADALRSAGEAAQATTEALGALNTADNYNRMTVAELRALAADRGLKIPSKWRKADIIIALSENN